MRFLHAELPSYGPMTVEISLTRPNANVMLLDPVNYAAYTRGRPFTYFGGFQTEIVGRIHVPRGDTWHLVVDLGGAPGEIGASYRVVA